MSNLYLFAESYFITLGKNKKHRIVITLQNFFEKKNFQPQINKHYSYKSLISCDLYLEINCDRETFISEIKQTNFGKVKSNSLILTFNVNFKQDNLTIEKKSDSYEIKVDYQADHQFLNEKYGKKCMEDDKKKPKKRAKPLKEITILRGKPMQGGGCSPR